MQKNNDIGDLQNMKNHTSSTILVLVIIFLLTTPVYPLVSPTITQQQTTPKNTLDDFDDTIQTFLTTAHWPSLALAIIKNNTMVWSHGYGYADLRQQRPATNTTVYMLASISKTFTATAIMQLWEQGLFDLDDDINQYLPFPVRNPYYPDVPITFRMLLTHHASLGSNFVNLFILFSVFRLPVDDLQGLLTPGGRFYNPRNWVDAQPGTTQVYSCIGYELLGYLVQRLTNQSLPEYVTQHILQPLHMTNTSYHPSDYTKTQLARQYLYILGAYIPLPEFEDRNYASGGLRSNLEDLSHYLLAYINGGEYQGVRILQNQTVSLMFTLQYQTTSYIGYGLGWQIYMNQNQSTNNLRIGHNGAMPGTQTYMFYHESEGAGIIILANQHFTYTWNDMMTWFSLIDLLVQKAGTY
jgi:CubicO group peptidase (beta-lactamase class C family)